ncbi:ankyrin repeat domain-containing protein 31-like isoform X3 [Thunnus albacares]|uniref:ankyrin repeat domain-containing protein 31-like isoform X3 n=1 Tax=Thunnus albacares TaxID=8236 RepID=UPI001CF674DA|nr:ankyrin repeat domain-containing protein 31-like isoform X3 [Thunnus albacares]
MATKAMSKQDVRPCCSGKRNILPAYKNSLTGKKVTWPKSVVTYTGKTLSLQVVNQRNHFGENLLHKAVLQGDIQMLKDILKLGPDVNMTDNAGWTALHEAVLRDQYEATLYLINAGALINVAAHNGVTPLHDAIRDGHKRIAELLLKHGANPLLKADDGETAFGINTEPSLRVLMEKNIPKDSPSAASGNRREELSGWTPLHEAALCGHYDVILDLIKAGAQVNATACNGDTPLHDAIANGHMKIVSALLRHGANPKLTGKGGQMALTTAAEPFPQRLVEENMTQNKRKDLPALTYQEKTHDDAQLDTGEDVFLNPQKATECKLNTELQSDDTDMGQTSARSQTAAVDMQENQKKSSTSPNVKASSPPPPLPLTSSPLQRSTPCCIPAPPKTPLCSTPVYASLFEGGTEEEDNESDQTVDYLDGSSDESVDWAVKATQNFNLSSGSLEAHVEDTYMYTFPTEMV